MALADGSIKVPPKPSTPNTKHQTPNTKHQTQTPNPKTQYAKPQTRDPKPQTPSPKPYSLNRNPQTPNPQLQLKTLTQAYRRFLGLFEAPANDPDAKHETWPTGLPNPQVNTYIYIYIYIYNIYKNRGERSGRQTRDVAHGPPQPPGEHKSL